MSYFVFKADPSIKGFKYHKSETIEDAEKFIEEELKATHDFDASLSAFVIVKGDKLEVSAKEIVTKVEIKEAINE